MPSSRETIIDQSALSPSSVIRRIVIRHEGMRSSQRKSHHEEDDHERAEWAEASTGTAQEAENVTDSNENTATESPPTCSSLTRSMSSSTIMTGSENDSCLRHQDSTRTLSHNSNSTSRLQRDVDRKRMTYRKTADIIAYAGSSTSTTTATSTISETEEQQNKSPQYFDNNDSMFNVEDLILQQHVIMRQIQRKATIFSENNKNKIEMKHYIDGASALRDSLNCVLAHTPTPPIPPVSRSSSTSPLVSSSSIQSHHNKIASPQQHLLQHSRSMYDCVSSSRTTTSTNLDAPCDENLLDFYDDPSAIEEQRRIMEQIENEKRPERIERDQQQQAYSPAEIEEQRRIMAQIENEKQRDEIHQHAGAADPSEIDEQDRIMAQIVQAQQQHRQREDQTNIGSPSSTTSEGRALASHCPQHQKPKKKRITVPSQRSSKNAADDELSSSVHGGRPPIARFSSSQPPGAAASSGRTKYRSLLQQDEDLTTSSSDKTSVLFLDSNSSACRRPSLAAGCFSQHSSEDSAARRKKYKSLLQKDEASLKAKKHDATCTKDYSEDSIAELYGSKKIHIHGTKQTMEEIAKGNAIFVQCPGCQTVLQVGSKAKLLYCTICTTVSPIDLIHDATGRNDSYLAEAFQEEEVEIKLRRKMAEKKPTRSQPS